MRAYVVFLPTLLVVSLGSVASSGKALRDVRPASIVSACNASESPQVQPFRRDMRRSDNVRWTENSGRATSWEIVPKDTLDWPFASRSIVGTPQAPADSGTPVSQAQEGHIYSYAVHIHCSDGSTQTIDPEIIIGDTEDFLP